MRHLSLVLVLSFCLTAAAGQASCLFSFDMNDCSQYPSAHCFDGGAGGGASGDSGPPPPACTPSMNSTPVAATCGVFVSSESGDDTNGKGTPTAPYKTIGKALATNPSAVYACAGTMPYSEPVTVSTAVTLFGALDCTSWAYSAATKTQLTAPSDSVPLTVGASASGTAVEDFAITAMDAATAGGSSIAVLDNGAQLALTRCDLTAGVGAPGAPGTAQAQLTTPASAKGGDGADDPTCNMTSNTAGGPGGTNACGSIPTNGGSGGRGTPLSVGEPGVSGQPMTPANGGAGQTTTPCQSGGNGNAATANVAATGMAGTGARGIGDVSASGYQPPVATLGEAGTPGQGGGGGGGGMACDPNDTPPMFAGPSGGGGGAGGCGGAAGNSGQSGGSSIGVLALGATLTLTNVTIAVKAGGTGGLGGDGQKGANGGLAGHAVGGAACDGGKGGQGGAGGPGGGGAGGHSVGIAIKGGALPDLSTTTITPTSGGTGGGGGDMDMTAQTKGDSGTTCKTLDFTTPTSPTACAM